MVVTRRDPREPPPIEVEVEAVGDGEAHGMAQVTAGVLRQASARQSRRAARLRGSLALQGTDHAFGVTVHFERERIRVTGHADPDALVVVEGPVMTLTKLASGGHAVRTCLRREVRVRGVLRHPLLVIRAHRLLGAL